MPFICGGYLYDGSNTYFDTCYGYLPMSDSWLEIGTMPSPRAFSAYAFLEGFGLVMAGGYDGSFLDSVIVTKDSSNFETLGSLPTTSRDGCLTVVNQTTLLLSGGYDGVDLDQALSYDIPTDTWTRYLGDIQGSAKRWSPGLVNLPLTTSAWLCLQHSRNLGTSF